MRHAFVLLIVTTLALPVTAEPPVEVEPADAEIPADDLAELTADPVVFATGYIRAFHESVCPGRRPGCLASIEATRRWQDAPELAARIVEAADAAGIPWPVLLVLTRYESNYATDRVGGRGEVGLAQVHGRAAQGHDLTTVEGQLAAGASWYAHCLERCGRRDRALAAYQSGRCRADVPGARLRYREIASIEDTFYGNMQSVFE